MGTRKKGATPPYPYPHPYPSRFALPFTLTLPDFRKGKGDDPCPSVALPPVLVCLERLMNQHEFVTPHEVFLHPVFWKGEVCNGPMSEILMVDDKHQPRFWLKASAPQNMSSIVVTRETCGAGDVGAEVARVRARERRSIEESRGPPPVGPREAGLARAGPRRPTCSAAG